MNNDDIKREIRAEGIRNLTLDTSAFEKQGLKLESGLLRRLEQLKEGSSQLILSEVIKSEVIAHIKKKTQDAQKSAKDSLKKAKQYLILTQQDTSFIDNLMDDEGKAEEISRSRFEVFENLTCLQVIEAKEEYVSVKKLLANYFGAQPPFAESGNKKNEFPDAIVLLSLESWAEQNQEKIIAVSLDKDWIRFCQSSERIFLVEDLAEALSLFQTPGADEILSHIEILYQAGNLSEIDEKVRDFLNEYFFDFEFNFEAYSSYMYDLESVSSSVESFNFINQFNQGQFFRVIKFEELCEHNGETLVLEAQVEVELDIEFTFSFSVSDPTDGDDIQIGSSTIKKREKVDAELLLSLYGDVNMIDIEKEHVSLDIDDIELEFSMPWMIDFGELSPDFEY